MNVIMTWSWILLRRGIIENLELHAHKRIKKVFYFSRFYPIIKTALSPNSS